jgi:hypothetical protein
VTEFFRGLKLHTESEDRATLSPEKISGDGVFLQAETKTHPGRIYESPGISVVETDINVVEPTSWLP